ncbi:hypothetical protein BKA70DRAFT_1563341 [Coprinopsis sp. MPI-PUGE-AT-0042]|nr:hypothetical protein BKA70DRAFT_1563341 [Coprinopsis sp. MPI-PUGE-AT-0042]
MPATLSNSPPEIISQIAWHLVNSQHHLIDAISSLSPLFLVSKHIYAALSPGHALSYSNGQRYPLQTELYARLCEAYVDVAAVKRRWWGRLRGPTTSALTAHFINVVRTLSFYKRSMRILRSVNEKEPMLPLAQTVYAPTVPLHLATTMLLCLEHDSKNMGLLFGVEAHMFIQMLMLRRLGEGRDENDLGWLVENIFNTLSLWCFWYVSSGRETLESETLSMREWVVNLILPFVVTPFRYASALSPPTHFTLPISNLSAHPPAVTWTAHGAYPPYYTREHPYSGYAIPPSAMQQQQQQQQQEEEEAATAAQTQAPQHLAGTVIEAVAELDVLHGEEHDARLAREGRTPHTAIEDGVAQGADSRFGGGGAGGPRDEPSPDARGDEPLPTPPPPPPPPPPSSDTQPSTSHHAPAQGHHPREDGPENRPASAHQRPRFNAHDPHAQRHAPHPDQPHAHAHTPPAHAPRPRSHRRQSSAGPPPPPPHQMPTRTGGPRPTPVNSHLHPSTGIHVFWYSSMGLWRAERERMMMHRRLLVHGPTTTAPLRQPRDDVSVLPTDIAGKTVATTTTTKMMTISGAAGTDKRKGKKRERTREKKKKREMSHGEARKRSRLDSRVSRGEWRRVFGETPEQSGDEGMISDDSGSDGDEDEDEDVDVDTVQDERWGEGMEWDSEEARKVWEEHSRSVEEEWAERRQRRRALRKESERLEAEAREANEKELEEERFYQLLVHPHAEEYEYDISARFPECASFDPLQRVASALSSSTTLSPPTTANHARGESTPTPYNAYAPLRILLPPASIPAKLIYLSRREMKPPQNPDRFRGGQQQQQQQPTPPAPVGVQQDPAAPTVDDAPGPPPDVPAEPAPTPPVPAAVPVPAQEPPAPAPVVQAPPPEPAPIQAPAPPVAAAPPPPPPPLQPAVRLGPRPTHPDILEVSNFRIAKVRGYASEADDMPEATSREYDTEWARMVLCWRMAEDGQASSWDSESWYSSAGERERIASVMGKNKQVGYPLLLSSQSRTLQWRNGRVYERGMLSGLWQGRMYVPADSSIAFLAGTRAYPRNLGETALGLNVIPMFVRFAEHGKVRVPGAVNHNSPIPAPTALTTVDSNHYHQQQQRHQFTDENMNNAWIEGRTGSLVWEYGGDGETPASSSSMLVGGTWGDGSTRDAIVERHREAEAGTNVLGELKERMKMKSVTLCVTDVNHAPSRGGEGAVMRKYVYETYEKGGECAHDRLERAQNVRSVRAVNADGTEHFYIHPGCLRCREKERIVKLVREKEEREKNEWKRQARLKEEMLARERKKREEERLVAELAEDMAESMFANHGLGMDEGAEMEGEDKAMREVVSIELGNRPRTRGGWTPIASHSGSPHHSRHTSSSGDEVPLDEPQDPLVDYTFDASHLPFCDDGVEDTLITGSVDERHENAWGRFVCYGRVRPWDGLVGFVRLQILPPDVADGDAFVPLPPSGQALGEGQHGPTREGGRLGDKFFFYGYIHAGKTIIGNWRYTGIEAVSATVESAFMISRKED